MFKDITSNSHKLSTIYTTREWGKVTKITSDTSHNKTWDKNVHTERIT